MKLRNITENLLNSLSNKPITLLTGPRNSGKSKLINSVQLDQKNRHYFSFDQPRITALAKKDPKTFIQDLPEYVTLEEIQHIPELLPLIKESTNTNKKPGRFLLTSSVNIRLFPKLSEPLYNQLTILPLWPLSQGELHKVKEGFIEELFSKKPLYLKKSILKRPSRPEILNSILTGGYPTISSLPTLRRRKAWFKSHLTTIFQRDIKTLSNITDKDALPRLLKTTASRTGSLLNFADLSRLLVLPQTTLKRYFALLEAVYLVELLQPWPKTPGERIIQTPKVYLNDTGLLASLLGVSNERFFYDQTVAAPLLENFVFMELKKQASWSTAQPTFYFWRNASGQEVDLLLENKKGELVGIEIKATATLSKKDTQGLQILAEKNGQKWLRGIIFYMGEEVISLASNLQAVPISHLWAPEYAHNKIHKSHQLDLFDTGS